ncbi:MAG: DUF2461 domain-containing protein [Cyclobacteriaceae bacterium]
MGFPELFDFLERLQKNNQKAWMDENRKEYLKVRNWFVSWLDKMNEKLSGIDPDYFDTPGKKGINRINNNLMFHPDRPIYKDHFSGGLDQLSKQGDFYVHFGVDESLIASGYYSPGSDVLKKIRAAIDYNGDEFLKILNDDRVRETFGGLWQGAEKLTNAPKGYASDHQFIDLLKYKTYALEYPLSRKDILSPDFEEQVVEVYRRMLPFRRYLQQAVNYTD